ncbi:hypothetical protein NM208_g13727 [Fusarium decemcellulare]|uniref:Uncharacterized protein n=1 Tax=Fusarium decemcellulare TaxID=57161 RepID=A0ACC1RLB2_9HYPO|nr:hypothetical protein NM208_g13727 [Fusarium decemcellulare]
MPLCLTCHSLDLSAGSPERVWSETLEVIQKRASLGCDFCCLVLGVALDHAIKLTQSSNFEDLDDYVFGVHLSLLGNGNSASKPLYNRLLVAVTRDIGSGTLKQYRVVSSQMNHDHEICIVADPDSPAYQSGLIGGRWLGMDITAPEYIKAISEWVQTCISSHEGCCQAISDGAIFDPFLANLPTRCIEVTATGAHLKETLGEAGSYVTLSHRWNSETEIVKTTPFNYQERISGADLGSLSKNFDAAITIVRKMRIKYLWIDSICIVQARDDWDQEKWRMGQYYQHALFTISAIGNGAQQLPGSSFLGTQSPRSLVRLPFKQGGVQKGSVYFYKRDQNADRLFHIDVNNSELNSRGWVFQERLLSKRIIYFTHRESFLECSSQIPRSFCNDMVKRSPLQLDRDLAKLTLNPWLNKTGKAPNDSEHDSPLNVWVTA